MSKTGSQSVHFTFKQMTQQKQDMVSLDTGDADGNTILHQISRDGAMEFFESLYSHAIIRRTVEYQMKLLTLRNKLGLTPRETAEQNGHAELATKLRAWEQRVGVTKAV
jgi:ankyrin repeat protein